MKNWSYGILAIGLATLWGCSKDDPQPVDLGLDYFPTEVGRYVEFLVDSNFVDEQFGSGSSYHIEYELRELIAEEFTDQEGRVSQRVERYVKDSVGDWIIRDVWTQFRSSSYAERVEENNRKLRLAFKPNFEKLWDLNALNNDSALETTAKIKYIEMGYIAIDEPYVVNGFVFDSTIAVNSTYPNNLVNTIHEYERFAKGVGLIEKKWVEINSQWDTPSQSWEDTGFTVTYTLRGYGVL